jgi:hypothetical protein
LDEVSYCARNRLEEGIEQMNAERPPLTLEQYESMSAALRAATEERATLAERERCAKIAENWHPMLYASEIGGAHPRDAAIMAAKQGIAKAIRDQES